MRIVALRIVALGLVVSCSCATEVISVPAPPCDQPILDGPVDSATALEIARCVVDSDAALLSLDGSGTGAAASEGVLASWDVILFGDGVVHAVGLAEGLQAGSASHAPTQLFPGGICNEVIALSVSSADVVPHALSAALGPLDGKSLGYRVASDCLAGGTSGRIVVSHAADRLVYGPDGKLLEECLACAAADARPCCAL
jgi:hypothetical protein